MTIGSQMLELDWEGGLFCPPYKIGSQNTKYKLGLTDVEFLISYGMLFHILTPL